MKTVRSHTKNAKIPGVLVHFFLFCRFWDEMHWIVALKS
jgi:hypothetical protein